MTTFLAGFYAFLLEHWMVLTAGLALAGAWLFICHELCLAAKPEPDMEDSATEPHAESPWVPRGGSRRFLSSQRQTLRPHPHASLRNRRSC